MAMLLQLTVAVCALLAAVQVQAFAPARLPVNRLAAARGAQHGRAPALSMVLGGLTEKLGGIVELIAGQSTITEENIDASLKEIKGTLIDADVNLQVANSLVSKVKAQALGMKLEAGQKPGEQFISLLAAEMVDIMGKDQVPLIRRTDGRPNIVLMSGLQGAGKTTAAAKLCNWAMKQSYAQKVLMVAADIYRPAAIDQLITLGGRLGVDVFTVPDESPVKISRGAVKKAIDEGYDMVIIDTAGRQVVDDNLMDELKQIKAAVKPDETLLVVDAMTGQEAATLTARFNEDIGITGAILTKMDGDTRGGSALSVRGVSGKPIKFVGVGEGMEDLEPFYPDRMTSRILGMGDIKSFLERAQEMMDPEAASQVTRKMAKGDFDFNDFLAQVSMTSKMGGMGRMLKMIPGGSKVSDEMLFAAEKRMKTCTSIIEGMTEEERSDPELLCKTGGKQELVVAARDRRLDLAGRVGMEVKEIDQFIMEYIQVRKMMKSQMKGVDLDAMEANPDQPIMTQNDKKASEKRSRKAKASRGGGGGFGN